MSDHQPFVHLHCHTHYSLLDGASPIGKLIDRAKSYGMNALAITDHGNLHGALEFYTKAKASGINPILGYEAYVAPGSRFERDAASSKDAAYHLTLLAKNRIGFQNLVKLASAASLEGFYFKPRIDKELLERYNEGLICLSGCVSSEFSRSILRGTDTAESEREAIQIAQWFSRLFGERYFIEIMNNGLPIQRMQLEGAVRIANKLGIPLVATSDAHYVDREDAISQDVLLCINTGKFRTDTNRMKMEGDQFYLRPPEEMYRHFPGLESAVARSQEIANQVDIELELGARHFPIYKLPETQSPDEYLRALCLRGLRERYAGNDDMAPDGELSQVVLDRLDRELSVIKKLGFSNYFLIVWDFVRYARENGIPATARGSGVGALVCFALYLSHVCPIRYNLLFERFLDENRKEAPDIDIDFCKERRGEVIRYVKEKYGDENVAQIGTFGTLAARAAIRDVGKVLGFSLPKVESIVGLVPSVLGIELANAVFQSDDPKKQDHFSPELHTAYQSDEETREILDMAMKIEGLCRNVGTHAAAVVIGDRPLTDYIPLARGTGKSDVITQWSMGDVEAAGLLKMDLLGLRNLTILAKAVELIEQSTGTRIDPLRFPLDDAKTFALLQRGETKGVFQLESGGIRDLLQKMKPDHFRDIIATNALYRPGPLEGGMVDDYIAVKNGRKRATYLHPILESILSETNGVMVYQEQVMLILNRLGGIELAKAYTCIKAISKKKESIIAENAEKFLQGAMAHGLTQAQAKEFWEMILKFAGYGFNKSHSTAYALIAYQTAYLKAHYPLEFMAALLTGDIPERNFKSKDSLVEHLEDCRRMGVVVSLPNINEGESDFVVHGDRIAFSLAALKGCGGSAAEAIVQERKSNGPFTSIFDFCERVDPAQCSKASIESLIKAGAFDSLHSNRAAVMAVLEKAMQMGASKLKDRRIGQMSLFGGDDDSTSNDGQQTYLPSFAPWSSGQQLVFEKEVTGTFLTAHPLDPFASQLAAVCSHSTSTLKGVKDRTEVMVGGMIASIKFANTRTSKPGAPTKYANFDLEDKDGTVRCILWPDGFAKKGELVRADSIVILRATVDRRGGGEEANLIVNDLIPIEQLEEQFTSGVSIYLDEKQHDESIVQQLKEIFRGYRGPLKVEFSVRLRSGEFVQIATERPKIELTMELKERLENLLGEKSYRLITSRPSLKRPESTSRSNYRPK